MSESFSVTTIECPHCKVAQKIHVAARPDAGSADQFISCIDCDTEFNVRLPEKIVGGPFRAYSF